MINEEKKIALLIDGENAEAKYLEAIVEEVSQLGRIIMKRVYGDFNDPHMKKWTEKLSTHALKPIQTVSTAKGKNAADIALVIDAMDILHKEHVDSFCIVSSDSDFTTLATRIRESGLFVIGIGKTHTPQSFINACDIFRNPEDFSVSEAQNKETVSIDTADIAMFRRAYERAAKDNGQALLSQLVEAIQRIDSSFDSRKYGFKKPHELFKSLSAEFEVIYHEDGKTISIKDIGSST